MSQILALEWDDREVRFVVAGTHGDQVVIERAFSAPLRAEPSGDEASENGTSEVDVGQQIADALSAEGVGRLDTLVAVGRSNIELRQLSLPPAPDDELPEMVRFQAMREFNELDERWLLDFIPIDETSEGGQNVLAAAIGPELVGQIEKTCRTAGLKPQRLVLRPCAAASLLRRTAGADPTRPRLLIDLLSDEADLTVMLGRKVIFLRTARLGGDPLRDAGQRQVFLGEIRRTVAAAQNQLGGQRVESIVLCDTSREHAELAEAIQANLGTATELFDPFDGLDLGRRLRNNLPDHPGRFAPLLGLALAELEETGHAVDFLHPRRRPEPPKKQARYILAGAAVALAVVAYLALGYVQKAGLKADIERLTKREKELKVEVAQAEETKALCDEIQKWSNRDYCWLDELANLSEKFPPAKEAMLTGLQLSAVSSEGQLDFTGLVDVPATIGKLDEKLRDESRQPEEAGSREEATEKDYSWWFRLVLLVTTNKEDR